MVRKYTLNIVKEYFKKEGCELLEIEYKNTKTKMKYICKNGHKTITIFETFIKGHRCIECAGLKKFTYEYVKSYFEKNNCQLISTEYIGNDNNLKFKCECGNVSDTSFHHFKDGVRCMNCTGTPKYTLEYMKKFFKENNCELLETEYKGVNIPMKYICECSNKSIIRYTDLKKGKRCMDCGDEKRSKSSIYYKDYKLPSGNIVKIQGYEYLALDELVKCYKEEDIITNRRQMPKISYELYGEHRYYPDIWIKSINKIIEVKSDYTYHLELVKNNKKGIATKNLGYNFEFWIYKGNTFEKTIIVV